MIIKTNLDLDTYLAHHGVKGQKWGRRKAKPTAKRQHDLFTTAASASVGGLAFLAARGRMLNLPVATAIGVGAAIGTRKLADVSADLVAKHHQKKLSELKGG